MTITINAVDSEFAVATGSNVNDGPGTSTFDYPPTSSSNLTITSNAGDPSPEQFSLGDTYDITYGNGGGGKGGTFDDAVVIRSDALPDGGHVVVFEGFNEEGNLEQIVWTPDFDLEGWYFGNFDQGAAPGFYTTDQSASSEYRYVCFASDTAVSTARGEVPAGKIRLGDMVETLDHGFQPVIWIGKRRVRIEPGCETSAPIVVQPNALNGSQLTRNVILSPQHRLLLRTSEGDEKFAPAKSFLNLPGVRRMRGRKQVEYVSLLCPRHEILNVSGLAAESFLPGPQALRLLGRDEILQLRQALNAAQRSFSMRQMSPARSCLGGSAGRREIEAGARLAAFRSDCSSYASVSGS